MTPNHKPPPPFLGPDTSLRLRFYFGRRLRDEIWLDAMDPETVPLASSVSAYHVRLAELADAVGVPWLVEVYDPAAPDGQRYLRYGTDAEAILTPGPIPVQPVGNHISGPLPVLDEREPGGEDGPVNAPGRHDGGS